MLRKIKVPDMHCEACVKRINKALADANLDFTVSLEQKTVTINNSENCLDTALKELEDLGFTPKAE